MAYRTRRSVRPPSFRLSLPPCVWWSWTVRNRWYPLLRYHIFFPIPSTGVPAYSPVPCGYRTTRRWGWNEVPDALSTRSLVSLWLIPGTILSSPRNKPWMSIAASFSRIAGGGSGNKGHLGMPFDKWTRSCQHTNSSLYVVCQNSVCLSVIFGRYFP